MVCAGQKGSFPNRHSELMAAESLANHNVGRILTLNFSFSCCSLLGHR